MSQGNVEVVRVSSMDAFLAVEFERALSYYCEDVVFQPLVGGPYHGRSGVAQQMQTWVDEFNDYWFEVDELIDAEDQVVLLWRDGGVGKSSGVRVKQEAATIYTVDDGCISHARVFATGPGPSKPPGCGVARYCAGDVAGERRRCAAHVRSV